MSVCVCVQNIGVLGITYEELSKKKVFSSFFDSKVALRVESALGVPGMKLELLIIFTYNLKFILRKNIEN